MSAVLYPLNADQGETFRFHFVYEDSAGVPINLVGATARMRVRDYYGAPAVLFDLTTENGGISLGGAAGTLDGFISAADMGVTVADAPGPRPTRDCVYDLEMTLSGDCFPLLYGPFTIARRAIS